MLLNELMEATPKKTAVVAWGRMNPPTIGHKKVIDVVKQYAQKFLGDPILFLSKSQKPKTDPLSFAEKLHFASEMFNIKIDRNTSIKTIIQMFQHLQGQGYDNVILVAGSDRVDQYQDLIDKYNNKPDKSGEIPFKFANAKVVSSGERDPDAEGVAGMSASKLKKLAAEGKFEDWKDEKGKTQPGFKSGVPGNETLAKQMYNRVRQGMGIQDETNEVFGFATRRPKSYTVKKRPPEKLDKNLNQKVKDRLQQIRKDAKTTEAGGLRQSAGMTKSAVIQMIADKIDDKYDINDPKDVEQLDKLLRSLVGKKIVPYGKNSYTITDEDITLAMEAAGVGIITKQNTTKDVNKGTLKKMLKGYKLI